MSGITTRAVASGATNVSTEGVALVIPFAGGCAANSSIAAPPGVGNPCKIRINGKINITAGAGTTAIVVKCRQGNNTVAGTQVGASATYSLAAGNNADIDFEFADTAANFAQAYSITVTQTGGTGAGNVNQASGYTTDYN